jgi:DNA-binding MarR family transcriptional regulator
MDLLEELGAFAFASRLKRLSDRLKAEATTIYHHQGVDFNDSWFQVGFMLSRTDKMGITEIARALGISRPAVSQMAGEMAKKHLITIQPDPKDGRRRLLSLTDYGREAVETLKPVWDAVGESTDGLIESTGLDVLKAITDIERGLEHRSLFSRVIGKLDGPEEKEVSNGC